MTTPEPASYLKLYLEPLQVFLQRPEVTDIYVNRPGEVWIELLGGEIATYQVPDLSEAALSNLAQQIASINHQGISRHQPLLSATLPDGARVQIAAPPATRAHMAVAIRRHISSSLPLANYADRSETDDAGLVSSDLQRLLAGKNYPAFLAQAVARKLNVVVSGGTSAGKTTLLNSLISQISEQERLIFIEDTPELTLNHPNSLGLIAVRGSEGEAQVTADQLLQAALRMRPDRIILGELRGAEAFTFLRAINTGHPGSLTTVHADSPNGAITQLAMMALQAGLGIAYSELKILVHDMVDVVVQVRRHKGIRYISEIITTRSLDA